MNDGVVLESANVWLSEHFWNALEFQWKLEIDLNN